MTPAARVQSSIEILDLIVLAAKAQAAPADRILADWFRAHRFAGSKDRRAIRELVYRAIRACGPIPDSGRAAILRLAEEDDALIPLFDGSHYGPRTTDAADKAAAAGVAPNWLVERLAASEIAGPEATALLDRAPLDLRVNTLKAQRDGLALPEDATSTDASNGLRLAPGTPVEQWDAYRNGEIEIQDTGSQFACQAVLAQPGETIVDLCAGAGGKTLALAAAMDNRGRLIACDTDRSRLSRLAPRAERAGAEIIETRLLDPGKEEAALADFIGQADAVLIDAPCSGTGTWRRKPEARWRLTDGSLAKLRVTQRELLALGARLLKPGGRLIYVVCSLLDEEGADQFDRFLADNPNFESQALSLPLGAPRKRGIRLTPYRDGTDGFFIACARQP
ncbi:MAG: RsmB/NOP family class I SAM-dependent RNA methyltransferase [Sphingomonadaceae bacterium]